MAHTLSIELRGDKYRANQLSLAHTTRLLYNFRKGNSFQNLQINSSTTNFFDETGAYIGKIYMQTVNGTENVIVEVPPLPSIPTEKKEKKKEPAFYYKIVPVIMEQTGKGFVACMSGTFDGPYKWFRNKDDIPLSAFYDIGTVGRDDLTAIEDNTKISDTPIGDELYFLAPTGQAPTGVSDWPYDPGSPGSDTHVVLDGGYDVEICYTYSKDYTVSSPTETITLYNWTAYAMYPATLVQSGSTEVSMDVTIWGRPSGVLAYKETDVSSGTYLYDGKHVSIEMPSWQVGHYDCNDTFIIESWTDDGIRWADASGRSFLDTKCRCLADRDPLSSPDPVATLVEKDYQNTTSLIGVSLQLDNESFKAEYDSITELAGMYTYSYTDSSVLSTYSLTTCGRTGDNTNTSTSTTYHKFVFNVDTTEHVISEYTPASGILSYAAGDDNLKYYGISHDRFSETTALLAVAERLTGIGYHKFMYIYVGNKSGGGLATTEFTSKYSDVVESYLFQHNIETIGGVSQGVDDPELVFEGKVFMGRVKIIVPE